LAKSTTSPRSFESQLVSHYSQSFSPLNITLYAQNHTTTNGTHITNLMANLTIVMHGLADKFYAYTKFDRLLVVNVPLDKDYELSKGLPTHKDGYDVLLSASCTAKGQHLIPVFVEATDFTRKIYYFSQGKWRPVPLGSPLAQDIRKHVRLGNAIGCANADFTSHLSSNHVVLKVKYALIPPVTTCSDGEYVLVGLKGAVTIPILVINFKSRLPFFKYVFIHDSNGVVRYPVNNHEYHAIFADVPAMKPMSMALQVDRFTFVHSSDKGTASCWTVASKDTPPHIFGKDEVIKSFVLSFLVIILPWILFLIAYVLSMSKPSTTVPDTLSYVPNKSRKPWEVNAFFKVGAEGKCDPDGVVAVLLSLLFRHKIEIVNQETPKGKKCYIVIKDTNGLEHEEQLVLDIVKCLPYDKKVKGYELGNADDRSLVKVSVVTSKNYDEAMHSYRTMKRFVNCVFGFNQLIYDGWKGVMMAFSQYFGILTIMLMVVGVLKLFNVPLLYVGVPLVLLGIAMMVSYLGSSLKEGVIQTLGMIVFFGLTVVLAVSLLLLYTTPFFAVSLDVWLVAAYVLIFVFLMGSLAQAGLFDKWKAEAFTEYLQWQAFANFLSSEADIGKYSEADVQMWKDWLVYAAALGVADKAFKKLKDKFGAELEEFNNASLMYNTAINTAVFANMMVPPTNPNSGQGPGMGGNFGGAFDVGSDGGGFGSGAI